MSAAAIGPEPSRDPADYWAEPGYLAALDDDDPGPDTDGPDGPAEKVYEHLVERRVQRLRIDEEARRRVRAEHTAEAPPAQLLNEFLAVHDDPIRYRIDGLLPVGGRALLAAQFKVGKSTMAGNLMRALTDGATFLGRDVTIPDGRTVLIDDELDPRMLRTWLRDQQIHRADRAAVIPLRGRVSSFNIVDPAVRAQWAEQLAALQPDFVILDCLRPILDAIGLDEDKEAGLFLVAFDELMRAASIGEALVVHHMGHAGERSRGSSRLRDWPDVEWRYVREDPDDPASPRYFSAYGRDVDVPETQLGYHPATRALHVIGGNRRDAEARGLVGTLTDWLTTHPAATQRECEAALMEAGAGRRAARDAVRKAVAEGAVITAPGAHRSTLHYSRDAVERNPSGSPDVSPPTPLFPVSAGDEPSAPVRHPPAHWTPEDDHRCAMSENRERAGEKPSAPVRHSAPPSAAHSAPDRLIKRVGDPAHCNGAADETGEPPPDEICPRCNHGVDQLVNGLCPRCAYPAGGAPHEDHEESPLPDPGNPPNFTATYPLGGEKIGPAWRAAWRALCDEPRSWHPVGDLVTAMRDAAQIIDPTARNLLRSARKAGLLEVVYADPQPGSPHPRARYRIAPTRPT